MYLHITGKAKGTKEGGEGERHTHRGREGRKYVALLNSTDSKKEYLF